MRILLCGNNEKGIGGVETYLREVMRALEARGHDCLYGYDVPGGMGSDVSTPGRSQRLSDTPAREAQAFQPDVIFQNGLQEARRELSLTRVAPVAFYVHDYRGMCISGTRRFAIPARAVCDRVFGAGCWGPYFIRRCGGLDPRTAIRLYKENVLRGRSIRGAALVLCASKYMRDRLVEHDVLPERIHRIPPFTFQPGIVRNAIGRFAALKLGFLGRVTDLKGWQELLQTVTFLRSSGKNWHLVVVGDGPQLPRLREVARHRRIPVEFHGWLEAQERDRIIGECTLLLLPSTWPEPFGRVGLEAAGLGVPSVAFAVGGIPEWLSPGINGELAQPGNARALADAVERAVASRTHYEDLSEGAVQMAKRFSGSRHVEELEVAFAAAIENRGRKAIRPGVANGLNEEEAHSS